MTGPLDLGSTRRIHVVGVGGAGMSAIASVLAALGHTVTGSDLKDSPSLQRARADGVSVEVGHARENVGSADLVAISTAIPEHNVEVREARAREIPVVSRAEILSALTRLKSTIAVAGTHGKTTTSSMLALVLRDSGLAPSFVIGGRLNEIGSGAAWDGNGEWFVVEADESDGTFCDLDRQAAIVTSVEPDHLEHFGTMADLEAAFGRFVDGVTGPVVVCADDPGAARLADRRPVITYGLADGADVRIVDLEPTRTTADFSLVRGDTVTPVHLPVPGVHNVANATAAIVVAAEIGVPIERAAAGVARFGGVARRFEFRGDAGGVTFVDDYAHLPAEVAAALAAARSGGWERVIAVFQPHRYSRTAALWSTFADAFGDADAVIVTDIFAAGETPRPGVSAELIANAVHEAHPTLDLRYIGARTDVLDHLVAVLRPGDLCITLGAGDLTTLPDDLLRALSARSGA